MGRKRITLNCIQNDKARKIVFIQRSKGLLKKISDFSIMCGAEACLIVYDGDGDARPITWPSDPTMVHSIIEKYKQKKNEKAPKAFDLEDFFENRKDMVQYEISRVQKEILKIKYPTWGPCFSNTGEEQLRALIAILDAKIGACDKKINMLKKEKSSEASQQIIFTSSHPNQLGFMQNISQGQLFPIPTIMQNIFQGQLISIPTKPHHDNNGMVDFTNQVDDVHLDSTNQLCEHAHLADPLGEHVSLDSQLVKLDDWANYLGVDLGVGLMHSS